MKQLTRNKLKEVSFLKFCLKREQEEVYFNLRKKNFLSRELYILKKELLNRLGPSKKGLKQFFKFFLPTISFFFFDQNLLKDERQELYVLEQQKFFEVRELYDEKNKKKFIFWLYRQLPLNISR